MIPPLNHIGTQVDNTASEGWAWRGIFNSKTTVGPLLRVSSWITRQAQIHASVERIAGLNSKESDTVSRLTYLTVHYLFEHFHYTSPQPYPWRLCLLPCAVRQRIIHCFTHICHQRPLLNQDPQRHHSLVEMVQHLPMATNPTRPPWNQGYYAIPSKLCSQGTHRSTCSQEEGYSKTKRGSIHPLHGPNLCGRGGPRPPIQ